MNTGTVQSSTRSRRKKPHKLKLPPLPHPRVPVSPHLFSYHVQNPSLNRQHPRKEKGKQNFYLISLYNQVYLPLQELAGGYKMKFDEFKIILEDINDEWAKIGDRKWHKYKPREDEWCCFVR